MTNISNFFGDYSKFPGAGGRSGTENRGAALHIAHRRSPSELTPLVKQHAPQDQPEALQFSRPHSHNTQNRQFLYPPSTSHNVQAQYTHKASYSVDTAFTPPNSGNSSQMLHRKASFSSPPRQIEQTSPSYSQNFSGHSRRHSLALPEAVRAAEIRAHNNLQQSMARPSSKDQEIASFRPFRFSATGSGSSANKRNAGLYNYDEDSSTFGPAAEQFVNRESLSDFRSSAFSYKQPDHSDGLRFGYGQMMSPPSSSDYGIAQCLSKTKHQPHASLQEPYSFTRYGHQKHKSVNLPPSSYRGPPLAKGSQRKNLFAPYLPQTALAQLIAEGRLVSGILRVNKKNRSDAYVITDILDHPIFISGSKDRNRALNGDIVAVELLNVDELWNDIRDKANKKNRKELGASRDMLTNALSNMKLDNKKDDIEVEGQTLMLVYEEEYSDERKPLYAGHVVAIIERAPIRQFCGTLGLLRPSSTAAKERQEAEKKEREYISPGRGQSTVDAPKIVWFKPKDKRVPLMAIPREQAPAKFVEEHAAYANTIFVASLKRWPMTSLHPFGVLQGEVGLIGKFNSGIDAVLHTYSFTREPFSGAALREVRDFVVDRKTIISRALKEQNRVDLRDHTVVAMVKYADEFVGSAVSCMQRTPGIVEVMLHVTDVEHYVRPGSALDADAMRRLVMFDYLHGETRLYPNEFTEKLLNMRAGGDVLAMTVSFVYDLATEDVLQTNFCRSVVRVHHTLTYEQVQQVTSSHAGGVAVPKDVRECLQLLNVVAMKIRQQRLNADDISSEALPLIRKLDEEDEVPDRCGNIFFGDLGRLIEEEITITSNLALAQKIAQVFPTTAVLRRQRAPYPVDVERFLAQCRARGVDVDVSRGGAILASLLKIENSDIRKACECELFKIIPGGQYFVSGEKSVAQWSHYTVNTPIYTHFSAPHRRYVDLLVQRQLAAVLSNNEEAQLTSGETLQRLVEQCNNRADAMAAAREEIAHLHICRGIECDRRAGRRCVYKALVTSCQENSFNVLIPDVGVEKRVYLEQLPLHHSRFDRTNRSLELFWIRGIDTLNVDDDKNDDSDNERDGVHDDEDSTSMIRSSDLTDAVESVSRSLTIHDKNCIQSIREMEPIMVFLMAETQNHTPPLMVVKPLNPFYTLD